MNHVRCTSDVPPIIPGVPAKCGAPATESFNEEPRCMPCHSRHVHALCVSGARRAVRNIKDGHPRAEEYLVQELEWLYLLGANDARDAMALR